MNERLIIKQTDSDDANFQLLISHLDKELWDELNEDQATYDQYNKVPNIKTALVIFDNELPIACGCFKKYNTDTVEIKRMFVEKKYRGKGISKMVLQQLETWAFEIGYKFSILETSVHFVPAKTLYITSGYHIIPNYDQYATMQESVCMKKKLQELFNIN